MNQPSSASPHRTAALAESISIMARLRGPQGCPWDREQTFNSIKRHTLEETYEVFDAIDRCAWPDLKDELGDLLLQVLFYAQMAEEAGHFSIEDVAANLNAKLIRRHPHIFADGVAHSSADVKATWEAIKRTEKSHSAPAEDRFLDSVPTHMPAFIEATKLGEHAAKVGFDWPSAAELLRKLNEETGELSEEVHRTNPDTEAMEDELGDLLFTTVNLARHLGCEPEFALRRANRKFRSRFNHMEAVSGGIAGLRTATPDQLDTMWRAAKHALSTVQEASQAAAESRPGSSSPEPG